MTAPHALADPLKLRHLLRLPLMAQGIGPARVVLYSPILLVGIPLLWAHASGAMFGEEALLLPANWYILVSPFVLAAIAHYYSETGLLFDRLIARGVLTHASGDAVLMREAISRIGQDLARSWVGRLGAAAPYVVLVAAPVAVFVNGLDTYHFGDWLFLNGGGIKPIAWYFVPLFHGVVMSMIAVWASGHLRVARGLERVMRGEHGLRVQLRVPHPDGCMGLGPVADLVRHSVLVLVMLSLLLYLWTGAATGTGSFAERLGRLMHDDVAVPWSFYCVFSPILFFAPLVAARQSMWTAKQHALAAAGTQVMQTPVSGEWQSSELLFARIDAASVWPSRQRTLAWFAAAMLLPLLLATLTELLMRAVNQ